MNEFNDQFDRIIDRSGTNAMAMEGFRNYLFKGADINLRYDDKDLIMMWVADMAFAAPEAATDAMRERIDHGIFGYTANLDGHYYQAFHHWTKTRHNFTFAQESLVLSSGVIPALFSLVELVCAKDEKVLTLTPAYGFFKHAAVHHHRELVSSNLVVKDEQYGIDFDDFRAKAADPKVRLFFLCHPHNPTGRIWREPELREMAQICFENDVLIVSDEIHCDLLRLDQSHIPMASLYPQSKSIVTCMAPSKTFNLAGMKIANVIIPDPELLDLWKQRNLPVVNPISLAAAQGVYQNGGPWLDALRAYLDQNLNELKEWLEEHLPKANFAIPEATYLAWIDLSAYFPQELNLTRFFAENAGVVLEGGDMFIENGDGRVRLNIACPRSVLRQCLQRMKMAVDSEFATIGVGVPKK